MLYSFGQVRATMLPLGMRTSSIFHSQHVATRRNMVAKRVQHVAPKHIAMCCVEMLRSFGRNLCWANNVGICCVEMLRSFGLGSIVVIPDQCEVWFLRGNWLL